MVAMPKPLDVKLDMIEFTFGGLFTFDCFESDSELAPVRLQACFYVLKSGAVSIASVWVNEGTKDHPFWIVTSLPRWQIELVEKSIAAGLRKERQKDARNVLEAAWGA